MEELLARLRSLGRRASAPHAQLLRAGDLTFDLLTRKAKRCGVELDFTAREAGLLKYFLKNPNRTLSRVELQQRVWGYGFEPGTNVVAVTMGRLRRKVDEDREPALIHTVPWQGYSLRTS